MSQMLMTICIYWTNVNDDNVNFQKQNCSFKSKNSAKKTISIKILSNEKINRINRVK